MSEKLENGSGKNGNFFINFNQDFSSLSVVSNNGYRLFSVQSVDRVDEIFCNNDQDTRIAERLFSSSLVAVVSKTEPNKLKVCHFKKLTEICNYSYPKDILRVLLNRSRLIVCLVDAIYIHNIRDMRLLHSIKNLAENPLGLCTLSMNSHLAYPTSETTGELQVYDAGNLSQRVKIAAHASPLSAMSFSFNGMLLATASQKGTVIRVFCTKNGQNLHEFRRGVKRYVTIASLTFSNCANYIVVSSNTETVHVFKLDAKVLEEVERINALKNNNDEDGEAENGSGFSITGLISSAASYLIPTNVLVQDRAFANVQLKEAGQKHQVVISKLDKELRIMVACEDGFLYVYDFDEEKGGDCKITKVHDLRGNLHGVIEVDNCGNDLDVPMEQSVAVHKMTTSVAPATFAGVLKGRPKDRMSGTEDR
ncbi:WD repeat domain phosphoinositide-interacting protein 2-like isoform X3 [Culicoides brevitarsis]|uniref:WD repeat domain phosphoinositide-interacting protein 2-like isoform X3 n=1 Tax=Culicoides brevitarsis TaxID=469753 RepID=UPI00307B7A7E